MKQLPLKKSGGGFVKEAVATLFDKKRLNFIKSRDVVTMCDEIEQQPRGGFYRPIQMNTYSRHGDSSPKIVSQT